MLTGPDILTFLQQAEPAKRLVVIPDPDPALVVEHGSIDLHLSQQVAKFDEIPNRAPKSLCLADEEDYVLAPSRLALWASEEYVEMPTSGLIGQMVGRSSFARLGVVTATASRVDPGYRGRLTLELVNLGAVPIVLRAGIWAGQLHLSRTTGPVGLPEPGVFRQSADQQETSLLLSFGEDDVSLVAQGDTGNVVRGPENHLFDLVVPTPFFVTGFLPALREFEDLVSSQGVTEAEVQQFLERYPEFLTGFDYVEAIPHVVLELESGTHRVPDFVLRPAGSDPCDVLEIKRPDARVVTNVAGRPVLSRTAAAGVAQLLEYSDILRSDDVRRRLEERYGLELAYPRLQLVVGRFRGTSAAAIRQAARTTGVDVQTYDSLLERAHLRLLRSRRDPRSH
ncbi:MAG: DUF4263 domain-containing protein [Actinobacteria bacterium]|nr:DUF4263 domain-containing protein [Actinomycetota bacterium]